VRSTPLRDLRFILDVHLGRLAAYLRMAGFDALYQNLASDAELARIALGERRVLLTRDRYLLMRREVDRGYWIRSTEPKLQFVEVLSRFDLVNSMRPFTRCMRCNSLLEWADRELLRSRLPASVMAKENLYVCPGCGRVYWEGSHHTRMKELLAWARSKARAIVHDVP
jgi:uncharacterized protein with PIN domain